MAAKMGSKRWLPSCQRAPRRAAKRLACPGKRDCYGPTTHGATLMTRVEHVPAGTRWKTLRRTTGRGTDPKPETLNPMLETCGKRHIHGSRHAHTCRQWHPAPASPLLHGARRQARTRTDTHPNMTPEKTLQDKAPAPGLSGRIANTTEYDGVHHATNYWWQRLAGADSGKECAGAGQRHPITANEMAVVLAQ